MNNEFEIVIIGAGPAGSSAALRIAQRDPDLARKILVLEKANFPRAKLCAGGVTTHADNLLARLGARVDVPSFPIHAIQFRYKNSSAVLRWKNIFRVVRREEFDTALARVAGARGVEIREGETVEDVRADANGVDVITRGKTWRAKIVIGADGANSIARKKIGLERWDRKSRLMEILTPVDSARAFEFENHTAVFDFTPIAHGVQGYYWDFPSVKQNVPTMNRGIFDARVYPHAPRADLKREFENALAQRAVELDDVHLMGHPERWYDPRAKHSAPRVLLAGDAAGTEPLLGEGISHAIHFGILAADAALDALRRENFSFANYERRIAWSRLGLHLRAKKIVAQVVFAAHGEWFYRWGFELLRILFANVNGESQSAT